MKIQEYGSPKVGFSWFLAEDSYTRDHYKKTLGTDEGKKQLLDAIFLCIDQGYEIRLGTDGCCLIFEANYADDSYSDASYQYVDDEHFVGELTKDGCYPDYYPEAVTYALEKVKHDIENINFDTLTKKELKDKILSLFLSFDKEVSTNEADD